jgi:hypothetical protein
MSHALNKVANSDLENSECKKLDPVLTHLLDVLAREAARRDYASLPFSSSDDDEAAQ